MRSSKEGKAKRVRKEKSQAAELTSGAGGMSKTWWSCRDAGAGAWGLQQHSAHSPFTPEACIATTSACLCEISSEYGRGCLKKDFWISLSLYMF